MRATAAIRKATLKRETFITSRQLEFTSIKELQAQTGQPGHAWPLVVLKELADNGLDECEEAGRSPVVLVIAIDSRKGTISVKDNGRGIPANTVAAVLDFDSRTSSREAYASPTRGAQGNALKTVLAMPFALGDSKDALTIIEAQGLRHTIRLSIDAIQRRPVIGHRQQPIERDPGTTVITHWPKSASSQWPSRKNEFLQFFIGYLLFNPHVAMTVLFDGKTVLNERCSDRDWVKWGPSDPTSAHWYDGPRFERLLAAYAGRSPDRSVREFITEFRGLSGSAKVAQILEDTGLHQVTLGDMFDKVGKPKSSIINDLLCAMKGDTKPVKPADLGVIGEDHFRKRFARYGADLDTFAFKRVLTTDLSNNTPVVIEVAFAYAPNLDRRYLFTGVNFSPAIKNPFTQLGLSGEGLERVLAGQMVESTDPVIVALHFTAPVIDYLDRGKSSIALGGGKPEAGIEEEQENPEHYLAEVWTLGNHGLAARLINTVKAVTKRWMKQRKAEERNRSAQANRLEALRRSRKKSQTTIAFTVMNEAYLKASGNDKLTANARQIMYAARPQIQNRSGRLLNDDYFTQTLLPNYVNEFDPPWRDKVAYDDRGHFTEPHTGKMVGVGTVAVRHYLGNMAEPEIKAAFETKIECAAPVGGSAACSFAKKRASTHCSSRCRSPSASISLLCPAKASQ